MNDNRLLIRIYPNNELNTIKLIKRRRKAKKRRHSSKQDKKLEKTRDIKPILKDETRECSLLWQSVVMQALQDIANLKKSEAVERRKAIAWFGQGSKQGQVTDFEYVCDLAGLDPYKMQRLARRVIHEGYRLPGHVYLRRNPTKRKSK